MLWLIATPIGNLKDISLRALETMRSCSYLLCEDTRHTKILLDSHNLSIPLKSYHRFSEKKQEETILNDLRSGLNIGLLSDAGMPGICDPGASLVRKVRSEALDVSLIPGPCALISALALSGLGDEPFQFLGYPPEKNIAVFLSRARNFEGISIFYVAPHDLIDILKECHDWPITIAREMTKIYEEVVTGSAKELLSHFQTHPPRGEMVLLMRGVKSSTIPFTAEQLFERLQNLGAPHREALRLVAELTGQRQKELYKRLKT